MLTSLGRLMELYLRLLVGCLEVLVLDQKLRFGRGRWILRLWRNLGAKHSELGSEIGGQGEH